VYKLNIEQLKNVVLKMQEYYSEQFHELRKGKETLSLVQKLLGVSVSLYALTERKWA
jgi:hypothetical protein